MPKARAYSPATLEAARLLGGQVRAARRARRWTVAELAERVGVTEPTVRKVERGDVSVGLGAALEAAAVLGVPLFGDDPQRRTLEAARLDDRLALLPSRVRRTRKVDNEF